jgi:hypothetical protein
MGSLRALVALSYLSGSSRSAGFPGKHSDSSALWLQLALPADAWYPDHHAQPFRNQQQPQRHVPAMCGAYVESSYLGNGGDGVIQRQDAASAVVMLTRSPCHVCMSALCRIQSRSTKRKETRCVKRHSAMPATASTPFEMGHAHAQRQLGGSTQLLPSEISHAMLFMVRVNSNVLDCSGTRPMQGHMPRAIRNMSYN